EVAVDALEASRAKFGLLVDEVRAQRAFEGVARSRQGLGPVASGIFAELDTSVEPRGDSACLRCADGGDGADRYAPLAPATAIAEKPLRAVRTQADPEAGNVIVPDLGLALARRQREHGDGVFGELHFG